MSLKQKIKNSREVKCFNVISNEKDPRFGLQCNRLLICKNSEGEVSGEIKCPRCGALYDIRNGEIYLIQRRKDR